MRKQPSQLTYLEILEKRKGLSDQERKYYNYLKRGYQGELKFDWYFDTYVQEPRLSLRNIHLEKGRRTQVDFLAVKGKTIYVFEIKNYEFDMTYDGDNWWISNNKKLTDNPIIQVLRMKQVIDSILADFDSKIQVIPVLVFINPDYFVDLQKESKITILRSFEIKRFLEHHFQNVYLDKQTEKLLNYIKTYTYNDNSNHSQEFTPVSLTEIKPGLTCPGCQQLNLQRKYHFVTCTCGATYTISQCLDHTICEYQSLFPATPLRAIEIHKFIDKAVSLRTVQKAVKAYKDKPATNP